MFHIIYRRDYMTKEDEPGAEQQYDEDENNMNNDVVLPDSTTSPRSPGESSPIKNHQQYFQNLEYENDENKHQNIKKRKIYDDMNDDEEFVDVHKLKNTEKGDECVLPTRGKE
eukprot:200437_1